MVGVCLTGIGLVKIIEARTGPVKVDEYLALDTLIFVASGLLSYSSLRRHRPGIKTTLYENAADALFIFGMLLMGVISVLFAFDIV